jgi:hypothetical protein
LAIGYLSRQNYVLGDLFELGFPHATSRFLYSPSGGGSFAPLSWAIDKEVFERLAAITCPRWTAHERKVISRSVVSAAASTRARLFCAAQFGNRNELLVLVRLIARII